MKFHIAEVNHALEKVETKGGLRLRFIMQVSFGKSERTNFIEFKRKNPAVAKMLGPQDVVAFVSKSGDQIRFVYGFDELYHEGKKFEVLVSANYRISGGQWNPLMLANYAAEMGLDLRGIKRFEDYYRKLMAS